MTQHTDVRELIDTGLLASLRAFEDEHARGIKHERGDAVILIDEAAKRIESLLSDIERLEAALRECRVFFQHATAQNTRAILAVIDDALNRSTDKGRSVEQPHLPHG